jgi:hypothetical protein
MKKLIITALLGLALMGSAFANSLQLPRNLNQQHPRGKKLLLEIAKSPTRGIGEYPVSRVGLFCF